jgi:hypothetical protein
MSGRGRPIRFLALVAVGWVGARIALLWPQTGSLPAAIEALIPLARAPAAEAAPVPARAERAVVMGPSPASPPAAARVMVSGMPRTPPLPDPLRVQLAMLGLIQYGKPEGDSPPAMLLPARAAPDRIDPLPDRWSASGWIVARGGRGIGAAPDGSQIGGSQAGIRIAYMLVPRERVALFARVTAPLAGKGREAALGVEWQPTRAPVRIVAERRFGLDGGPDGTGLGVIAGTDAQLGGFRLESYGQAGAIARTRLEPYADGALRATRPFAGRGGARLALGVGVWGAAQRDARRLDIGPSASLAVRNVRLSLDWRQRVAGDARPGSGLALTIGGDF